MTVPLTTGMFQAIQCRLSSAGLPATISMSWKMRTRLCAVAGMPVILKSGWTFPPFIEFFAGTMPPSGKELLSTSMLVEMTEATAAARGATGGGGRHPEAPARPLRRRRDSGQAAQRLSREFGSHVESPWLEKKRGGVYARAGSH